MGKKVFCVLFLLFFSLLCLPVVALPTTQELTLQTLSAEIHVQLENLKQQSRLLTEQLMAVESELHISSKQVETLQMELNELNTCLSSTNWKLKDYSKKLMQYETKLKFRAKIILIATLFLAVFIIVRIILLILKIKFGIKIPYLINLLL